MKRIFPEEDAIEIALVRVLEKRGKMLAALGALPAAFLVDALVNDLVPGLTTPLAQLAQLVLGILAFVVRADTRLNSYAHLYALPLRESLCGLPNVYGSTS